MTEGGFRQRDSGLDATVEDPSDDLLDMDQHARALARYIRRNTDKLPFTVAVIGKWGQGKSTLVRLLHYHLEHPEGAADRQPVNFVTFSSWPYNTTEKLWRALIVEIARELYQPAGPDDKSQGQQRPGQQPEPPPDSGLVASVQNFLAGDAFHLHKPPPPPDQFRDFLEKVEETDYGQVRHSGPDADGEALATMAGVALAALSAVSPLVASLRSLLGLEPKLQLSDLVRKERREGTSARLEPLTRFQNLFREMLDKRRNKEPVYIFVDDLDRAQPDVALDIIESIRIALFDAPCVFIVAVDLLLIEKGLRMRYKELFADDKTDEPGREYLEKIIQFTTPLPPATSGQVQRLIAGQFPEWAAAADIVEMVAGNNPRRVRQYCQYLSFQMLVARRAVTPSGDTDDQQPPAFDEDAEQLLNKLVQIHRRGEREQHVKVLRTLARLASHEAAFPSAAHQLEVAAGADAPQDATPPAAPAEEWNKLSEVLGRSAALRKLFASEPRLSGAAALRVATLAQFADFAPDERTMLATRDGVFAGVLEAVLRRNLTDAGQLIVEHLERFVKLYKDPRTDIGDIIKRLAALAATHHWQEVLASIEEAADYTDGPASEAGRAHKELQSIPGLRTLLLTPTPLSRVPAELFALAWERRAHFDEEREATQGAGDQLWADAALERMKKEPDSKKVLDRVEQTLALRIGAAQHLIGMRKLAKLDALTRKWEKADEIAARTGYAACVEVEEYLLRQAAGGMYEEVADEDARALLDMCEQDKLLARFLHTPPLFGQMSPAELSLFRRLVTRPPEPKKPRPATPVQPEPPPQAAPQPEVLTPPEPEPGPAQVAPVRPETRPEVRPEVLPEVAPEVMPEVAPEVVPEVVPELTPKPQLESPPEEEETTEPQPGDTRQSAGSGVDTFFFLLKHVGDAIGASGPIINATAALVRNYGGGGGGGGVGMARSMEVEFELSWKKVLRELPEAIGIPADRDPQSYLTRMFSRGDTDYQFRLTDAGHFLFSEFLGASWKKLLEADRDVHTVAEPNRPARVVIWTDSPALAALPWEWLSFPGQSVTFTSSPKHSLLRDFPGVEERKRKQFSSRPRVLIVIPGVTGRDSEVTRRQSVLAEVLDKMGVETAFLVGASATPEGLAGALFDFIPHILHFDGGLVFQPVPGGNEVLPCLRIYQSDGQPHSLALPELKKMLKSSGVQLMVFGNGTSTILQTNPLTEMLQGLMDNLLPTAVAPVRSVEDATAVEFTRSFYSALFSSPDLESAFIKARHGLVGKGGDWTAFALFGQARTVSEMRFSLPSI